MKSVHDALIASEVCTRFDQAAKSDGLRFICTAALNNHKNTIFRALDVDRAR